MPTSEKTRRLFGASGIAIFLIILLAISEIGSSLNPTNSKTIASNGTIVTPELGVWQVKSSDMIPQEASWVVAESPNYGSSNILENPSFEFGGISEPLDWSLYTPPNQTQLDTITENNGWDGKCAAMSSNEMGYQGGLLQYFPNVPSNTIFHFSIMIKTVDNDSLMTIPLYVGAYDAKGNWYGTQLPLVCGSTNWTLYENEFSTPNKMTNVTFCPALVYNEGEVWIDSANASMEPSPRIVPAILDWISLWSEDAGLLPFKTASQIEAVNRLLESVPAANFWGVIFITEEVYKSDIQFNDDVNTTWFNERLLSYPLYLSTNQSATVDEWRDEMYLRIIRGFYDYFHESTKVGITWGITDPDLWNKYYGQPAIALIKQHFDFLILYPYTASSEDFTQRTEPYLSLVDQNFPNQKKFWILTREWPYNEEYWQLEAMTLEINSCLERNIVITTYYESAPPFEDVWPLLLNATGYT